jgi:hypothetical protein
VVKNSAAFTTTKSAKVKNFRNFKPDAMKDAPDPTMDESLFILNEPARKILPEELIDLPRSDIFSRSYLEFMHPDALAQLRVDFPGKSGVPNHYQVFLHFNEEEHLTKLGEIKDRIKKSPQYQVGDDELCTDPFGLIAKGAIARGMSKLNGEETLGAAHGFFKTGAVVFATLYALDAILPFNISNVIAQPLVSPFLLQSEFANDVYNAGQDGISSTSGKIVASLPFALAGAASGCMINKRAWQYLDEFIPLSELGQAEKLAIVHLQRLHKLYDNGNYCQVTLDALNRHEIKLHDIIPNGDLIDLTFNSSFLLQDPPNHKKPHNADHGDEHH